MQSFIMITEYSCIITRNLGWITFKYILGCELDRQFLEVENEVDLVTFLLL